MKTIVCGLRNRSIWVHLGVLKSKCAFSFPWFGFEVCNGLLLTSLTPGCYLKPGIGQSLPSRSLTIPHEDCADFYVNVFIFMILYHHFFYRRGLICMFFFSFSLWSLFLLFICFLSFAVYYFHCVSVRAQTFVKVTCSLRRSQTPFTLIPLRNSSYFIAFFFFFWRNMDICKDSYKGHAAPDSAVVWCHRQGHRGEVEWSYWKKRTGCLWAWRC